MKLHLIRLKSKEELAQAAAMAGASAASLPFFEGRREALQLFIKDLPAPAANIVKQEALARNCDALVHAQTITCGVEYTDVILFGTARSLRFLADKLEKMPWWGLELCAAEIKRLTGGFSERKVKLPCGSELTFGRGTLIMGIINLTDDSFFAASRSGSDCEKAALTAVRMAEEGADILDLGAESTRPGAPRVSREQESERLVKAVCAIREKLPHIPLSIDTTRSQVAREALAAGADIINDVSGLSFDPETAAAAAQYHAMLAVMHMRGTPADMQSHCSYTNLISEVCGFLEESAAKAMAAGVPHDMLITDPGIGFAKNCEQNLMLLRHCESFRALGWPVLIGASRKGFIGAVTETKTAAERLAGTVAVTALCTAQNADIIRVHDVRPNKEAVMMTEAIWRGSYA